MFDNFDLQWLAEALFETGGRPLFMFPALLAAVTLGYLLLGTFLAGGAIAVFASEDGLYRPGLFFEGCGRNFGRLLRLALISWLFYGVALGLGAALTALGKYIWGQGMEERPLVIFGWFRTGLTILLLLLVNMIFDYAKIRLVVEDSRRSCGRRLRRLSWSSPTSAAPVLPTPGSGRRGGPGARLPRGRRPASAQPGAGDGPAPGAATGFHPGPDRGEARVLLEPVGDLPEHRGRAGAGRGSSRRYARRGPR